MTIDERIIKVEAKISELQDELGTWELFLTCLEDLKHNNEIGDILKYSKD